MFVFLLILALGDLLQFFAMKWFPYAAFYTVSFMVPITLTVMMRWGWPSVFYAALSGIIWCALNRGVGVDWAVYLIGNSFIALLLIPLKLIGKDKIKSKWWACMLLAIGGWMLVYLGRSTVFAIAFAISPVEDAFAYSGFVEFVQADALSLVMAVLVVLVLRKLNGMFEDQKSFLLRAEKERKEKQKIAEYGEPLAGLDEEALELLNRENDLYD